MSNKSLLNKFLSFSIGSWVTFIIGIFSTPIIMRMFKPEQYGIYSNFELYCNLAMIIIIFGIDQSFVRFFYVEEENNRKKLLFKCLKIPAITNIILIFIVIFFRKRISNFLFGNYSIVLILIFILHISFLLINRFALLVVRMQQKSKTYSLLVAMNKVFYLLMIFVTAFFLKNNYMALVLSLLFSNISVTILAIVCEKNYWSILKRDDSTNIKTNTRDIFAYGSPLVITTAIHYIFQSADKIAIQHFWGPNELGIYSGAAKIIALLTILQGCFTTFWVPVAFEKYEKNPEDTEFFEKANIIVAITMFACAIGLILFRDIIILFLGNDYKSAMFIIPFLSFMPIMYTASETTVLGINFKKKQKKHIYISVVSCAVNILGNFILVPKIGAVGAGISTGLSYIVFFSMRTYISGKYYKIDYHLKKFYGMTFALCIYAFYATFYKFGWMYLIIGIMELLLLYLLYRKYINEFITIVKKIIVEKIKIRQEM